MKRKVSNGPGIRLLIYDEPGVIEPESLPKTGIWLRVVGLKDTSVLEKICEHYQIHDLVLEDILNPRHQPKYERFESYSLFILKTFYYSNADGELLISPVNIVAGKEFILTFEDKTNNLISSYVKKITGKPGSTEHTVYDLLDTIIDHYLAFTYGYQERVYEIEDLLLESKGEYNLTKLFNLRRELHLFRRVIRPAQNMTESLLRPQSAHLHSPDMVPYINDLLDHASRANSLAEGLWETLNSIQTEIFTQLQYKLSRTMNIMTAVSLIFLPLMVITGIYGMNFDYMPELHFKYGYPAVLALMAVVGSGLFMLFVKRKMF